MVNFTGTNLFSNPAAGGVALRGGEGYGPMAQPGARGGGFVQGESGGGAMEGILSGGRVDFISYRLEVRTVTHEGAGDQARVGDFGAGFARDLPERFYQEQPLSSLSPSQAADLVSEDGFFGVRQTADRIAGFVLGGAGDDLEKLRAGREGILQGFAAAEKVWGGELPAISYDTLAETLKQVDERIAELDGRLVDVSA